MPDLEATPTTKGRETIGLPSAGPSLFFFGPSQRLQLGDEDVVRDVLVTKARSFHKPATMKRFMGPLLGRSSLLLAEGREHKVQRRIVAKAFAFDLLQGMIPTFGRCSEVAVRLLAPAKGSPPPLWHFNEHRKGSRSRLKPLPDDGSSVPVPSRFRDCPVLDASLAMSGLTLEIIAQSAFGGAFGSEHDDDDDDAAAAGSAAVGPAVLGDSKSAVVVMTALEATLNDTYALIARFPLAVIIPAFEPFALRPERAVATESRERLLGLTRAVVARRRAALAAKASSGPAEDLLDLIIESSASADEMRPDAAHAYSTGADATEGAAGGAVASRSAPRPAPPPGHGAIESVRLTDEEVQDQAVTFVMAGHETTSQLLTWAVFCLSQAPEWQGRLRAESAAFLAGHGGAAEAFAGVKDLQRRLPVNDAVLREVMRLYPPASIVVRNVAEPVSVGDGGRLSLPAGLDLVIPIAAMHRDASVFADPDDFDPCRWLDDAEVARLGMKRCGGAGLAEGQDPVAWARPALGKVSPYKYLPFSAGARNCVGQRFAMLEARVALAVLAAGTEWFLDNAYRHAPSIQVTTQPMFGMPVRFRRV